MFHLHRSSRLMHSVRVSSAFAVAHMYFSHVQASASINAIPESHVFDLIVIGGGSGGVACARRAASYGKKVAIVESKAFGGTCVNVGCVPKKIMYNTAHVAETIDQAKHFGFKVDKVSFDWLTLKNSRDAYIRRLNRIYENNLDSAKVQRINGFASFDGSAKEPLVRVGNEVYKASNVLIAVGGQPKALGIPGEEHVLDSDGFFALEHQPKRVAIVGAGYIAVEIAGVFNSLGTDTTLFVREHRALRNFDSTISSHLDSCMRKSGVKIMPHSILSSVSKGSDGKLAIKLSDGEVFNDFDAVLAAIGRTPAVAPLNLDAVGVKLNARGYVAVDEWQQTSTPGIYAVGDVIDNIQLTPVAIAAGRRLADRLFGGYSKAKMDYDMVPTVVFSHPTIGTVGLTEEEAVAKYGADKIKIYTSTFVNLWYGSFYGGGVGEKPFSKYKLVTLLPDEKIVGLHIIGEGSDEVLQGFGVALKLGATKADFDNCVAIHPTAAEELVTMPVWGMSSVHQRNLK